MVRPRMDHVKLVAYVNPKFKALLTEESKKRKIPLGLLIEEAFASRMLLIRKDVK